MKAQRCAKCPTQIVWAESDSTGKPMPVDAAPAENGNVRLVEYPDGVTATVLAKAEAERARANGERLHLNHFVTCARASEFRKPKVAHG